MKTPAHISRDPYPYNTQIAYGRSDYDVAKASRSSASGSRLSFSGSMAGLEKIAGGWTLAESRPSTPVLPGLPYIRRHDQIVLQHLQLRLPEPSPDLSGGGGNSTGNDASKTGSNFLNPGTASTGTNQDQFSNNYFEVPNYANAIADNPGQTATSFIPAPGIDA